jgi:hypothetical protein
MHFFCASSKSHMFMFDSMMFRLVIVGGLTLDRDLHRDSNPMAGSFSAYHGFTLIANRDIKAGEELFVDKSTGNLAQGQYFLSKHPSSDNYEEADEIMYAFQNENFDDLTDAQWVDVLHRLKTEIMPASNEKVAKALPSSLDEMRRAWEVGTARLPLRERTIDWIKTNGKSHIIRRSAVQSKAFLIQIMSTMMHRAGYHHPV